MTATINASTSAGVVTTADTSGILQLQTNGTAALTVDASQNVGIGITSPATKLHIVDALSGGQLLVANNQTNTTEKYGTFGTQHYTNAEEPALGMAVQSNATDNIVLMGGALGEFNAATQVRFYTAANNTTVTGSERMRIDSSGNVMTGLTSALGNFSINVTAGAPATSGSMSRGLTVTNTSGGRALNFGVNESGAYTYIQAAYVNNADVAQNLAFFTGPTERARITSAGDFLLNTTSFTGSGDTYRWSTTGVQLSRSANGDQIAFFTNGSLSGKITTSGTTTTYGTSSDYRLKNTIAPMTGALARVSALKPVTYKWNLDNSDGQGFIAHELAEVCPDAVQGEKDAVDAEGNPQYQGIDVSFLVATLTAAIQELKAIVDAQGAEIAALKGAAA